VYCTGWGKPAGNRTGTASGTGPGIKHVIRGKPVPAAGYPSHHRDLMSRRVTAVSDDDDDDEQSQEQVLALQNGEFRFVSSFLFLLTVLLQLTSRQCTHIN
jgi:hypothetical protein